MKKKEVAPKDPLTKLIDLPLEVVPTLKALANKENRTFKSYLEWVLIQHAKDGAKGLK